MHMNAGATFALIVPLIGVAVILGAFLHAPWTPMRVAGLVITVVFIGLLTVVRLQLENAFSLTPQARSLVTRGVYSKIRHPVYVFSALALAGLVLYIDRPKLLLLALVVVPIQIARARAEERVLAEKFGDSYREYKRSTWF